MTAEEWTELALDNAGTHLRDAKREIAKHIELAMREASEGAVLPPATPTPCAWLLLFVPPILVVVAALAWDRLRHIAREFAAVFGRQEEQ